MDKIEQYLIRILKQVSTLLLHDALKKTFIKPTHHYFIYNILRDIQILIPRDIFTLERASQQMKLQSFSSAVFLIMKMNTKH